MDVLKAFGTALRRARDHRRLTQEELAHRAGVTVGYLSQLENGRRNPTLLIITALCGALEITLPELINETTVNSRPNSDRDNSRDD
ncbi:helix-turn-helix domain-containing protein [Azospirillum brasilense]|uniref:helix-turn-helix domain-containing protein n=1 Tax=Azospirillum brasilense TaxID=192 RepID=UPI0035ABBAC9